MIPVTKPFLPPVEKYERYLRDIWQRNWLTNNGPLVIELESRLREYLAIRELLFVTNGTIAIQLAIRALGLRGQIITTPFSYVATTSSIVWEGCEPVFVDIDSRTCNLDPNRIEEAITPQTSAILATHVYGNPCDVKAIQAIAQKRNLKVIYDGAHAFGVKVNGKSVFEFGDISTCSFHATKLFHTVEGGAVVTSDPDVLKHLIYLRNFGHDGYERFAELGTNGKNSEFHAAMGLANLDYINQIIEKRKLLCEHYDRLLKNLRADRPAVHKDAEYNYAYYPVIFHEGDVLLKVFKALELQDIHPRRYFYPSLETLPYVQRGNHCPLATSVSERVLCLPLFDSLTLDEIEMVCELILKVQNNS